MKKYLHLGLSIVALSALASTINAQAPTEKEAVANFYREWSTATFKEGPEGYARYFAEDGAVLPPDETPAIGRAAVKEWLRRTQAEATFVTKPEKITQDDIRIEGNVAVVRTTLRGTRTPKAGGAAVAFENKYLDVLRKNAEGRWEFVYRMWNGNLTPKH